MAVIHVAYNKMERSRTVHPKKLNFHDGWEKEERCNKNKCRVKTEWGGCRVERERER